MSTQTVTLIPGDGIGPEVTAAAVRVLEAAGGRLEWEPHVVGLEAIAHHEEALPPRVVDSIRRNKVRLKGPVTTPVGKGFRSINVQLRQALELYANLRPVRPWPALYEASPLRRERIEGTDLLVVRELTGGLYFGDRGREPDSAYDTCVYSREEVARLAEVGFQAARGRRGKVTSVDKANVLETSRLWREQVVNTA